MANGEAHALRLSREALGWCLAFSRDGTSLVSGSYLNLLVVPVSAIVVWDTATWRKVRRFRPGASVDTVALSPDGKLLAAGAWGLGRRNRFKLWDLRTGSPVRLLTERGIGVKSIAFSPDGSKLALSNYSSVRVVDIVSRSELWRFSLGNSFLCVAFSPDGQLLAAAHSDGTVRLWDGRTGRIHSTLKGHTAAVQWVAFSPDGKTLASCGNDGTVRVWDVASGKELEALRGHQSIVYSVAFSPDGKTLASGSGDGTVELWDVATGREIRTFTMGK